jgi:hypothetical protein
MGNCSRFHSPKPGTSETKTGSFELSSYLLGYILLGLWLRLHSGEGSKQGTQAQQLLPGEATRKEAVPADPTRRKTLAQARESLEQGCTATAQVGLLIAQAKTASAQVRERNWPLVRSVLAMVYRAISAATCVASAAITACVCFRSFS